MNLTDTEDFDWDEFLVALAEQRVIPIIGKDLLRIEVEGQSRLFEQYLAQKFTASLGRQSMPANITLNEVYFLSMIAIMMAIEPNIMCLQSTGIIDIF